MASAAGSVIGFAADWVRIVVHKSAEIAAPHLPFIKPVYEQKLHGSVFLAVRELQRPDECVVTGLHVSLGGDEREGEARLNFQLEYRTFIGLIK